MSSRALTLLAAGDNILGPGAEFYFAPVVPTLRAADLVVGQLEVPYTARDAEALALGRDPENLQALVSAGMQLVTLAGNHIADAGVTGIEDTLGWLRGHGIGCTGAGMNLREARCPTIVERGGVRFGFLSYNCVGPKETWAGANRPGCAFIHVITHYELDHATPGGPPAIYTWAEPDTLGAMEEDIRQLRSRCDVLIVSLHKGLVHTPVKIAAYEQQVSYAAIDAGADLVVGHHAHILKGIEVYRGKTIFHGLCNLVAWLPSLAKPGADPQGWASRRRELFGFVPDPEYPTYPFHPEARYTIMARCIIEGDKITGTSYLPCLVNKQGQPEVMKQDERGRKVFEYMEKITKAAGLNAQFVWQGDLVSIVGASNQHQQEEK